MQTYEDAVLEYSYLINVHQSKNILGSALGGTTGSFDHKGEVTAGPTNAQLKYPKLNFEIAFKIGDKFATEAGVGGTQQFILLPLQQLMISKTTIFKLF